MFSLNFIFYRSLIEELSTKEENDKTGCNFNFGHECSTCISKGRGAAILITFFFQSFTLQFHYIEESFLKATSYQFIDVLMKWTLMTMEWTEEENIFLFVGSMTKI